MISAADQEEVIKSIIPGTSVLLGGGASSAGELWTSETLEKLKPIGCEIQVSAKKQRKLRKDGYVVSDQEVTWLTSEGQRHIKQVACGSLHTILLEFNGRCWALGGNEYGQLGLGHKSKVKYPTLIRGGIRNQHIECVHVGGWFSAFLSKTGQVFTCGEISRMFWNKSTLTKVPMAFKPDVSERKTTQYLPKEVPINANNTCRICKIGCGNQFLLMQDVYTMNVYRLGNSDVRNRDTMDPYPSLMHYIHPESLERNPINFLCKKIDAGGDFSFLLDYQGKLFVSAKMEDYVHQQYFYSQNVHVIDVCCSWFQYIALDAHGYAHVCDPNRPELVITLHTLGRVNQIGSGPRRMYARSDKRVYKIQEMYGQHNKVPTLLEFESDVDQNENTIINITGSSQTTIIHQAITRRSTLTLNINLLRLKQLLCDATVICNIYEES